MPKLTPEQQIKLTTPDGGWIQLIDIMGSDAEIEEAARVSYGEGTRALSDTTTLLRYLLRHRHTTPFEMAEAKFLVHCPMDTWRQWIRHRTANVNEYSTRYSVAIDHAARAVEWRTQSDANKQGSGGPVTAYPEGSEKYQSAVTSAGGTVLENRTYIDPQVYLSQREEELQAHARDVYEERLKFDVAREQARKDLPLSTFTQSYWKCDLHNILHFLSLRMEAHAQLEIREYANAMHTLLTPHFPIVMQAFMDYKLNSIQLSAQQVAVIRVVLAEAKIDKAQMTDMVRDMFPKSPTFTDRELGEFLTSLGY